MAFRNTPPRKLKKQLGSVKPCCSAHLDKWDCGCSWGCDLCWVSFTCTVCHAKYSAEMATSIKETSV